jgi:hypothetical protein
MFSNTKLCGIHAERQANDRNGAVSPFREQRRLHIGTRIHVSPYPKWDLRLFEFGNIQRLDPEDEQCPVIVSTLPGFAKHLLIRI